METKLVWYVFNDLKFILHASSDKPDLLALVFQFSVTQNTQIEHKWSSTWEYIEHGSEPRDKPPTKAGSLDALKPRALRSFVVSRAIFQDIL